MEALSTQKTWYVYLLCDPDTEKPFYVGKGSGNRMDHHTAKAASDNPAKKAVLQRLQSQGKQVLRKKVAEFTNEQDAYIYEWGLIYMYGDQLTNIRPGGAGGKHREPKAPKVRENTPRQRVKKRLYTEADPYMPIDQVADSLGWSKAKLFQAVNKLGIKKYKFRLHVDSWIATEDMALLRKHEPIMGGPRGPRRKQAQ